MIFGKVIVGEWVLVIKVKFCEINFFVMDIGVLGLNKKLVLRVLIKIKIVLL